MNRREALWTLIGGSWAARAIAQAPEFSTGVKVVNIFATARDKKGAQVTDLSQADFEIREDGRPQVVRYFARQTDTPLTLGMLIDTSQSMRTVLEEERAAGKEFFWDVLRPDKDNAFIIAFDVKVELVEDSTNSLKKLGDALETVDVPEMRGARQGGRRAPGGPGGGGPGGGGPGGGGLGGGIGTLLYDAVFLAGDEVMKEEVTKEKQGRKAIILLSDGEDHGSRVSLSSAIEAVQKADTAIYAIHIAERRGGAAVGSLGPIVIGGGGGRRGGRGGPGGGPGGAGRPQAGGIGGGNGAKVMKRLAEETGGGFYEANGKTNFDKIFLEIERDLRNQYSLGFVSDRAEAHGEFRTLDVRTKRKNATIRARQGYYAS